MRLKPRSAMAGPPLAIAFALLLAACGANDNDPGPGGVTVGEARALDEAAEMLDAQRLPADALPADEPVAGPSPETETGAGAAN